MLGETRLRTLLADCGQVVILDANSTFVFEESATSTPRDRFLAMPWSPDIELVAAEDVGSLDPSVLFSRYLRRD